MNTLNEKQVIEHLINTIHTSLRELAESNKLYGENGFRTGQIYAYAEYLEVLQLCQTFRAIHLNYNIEKKYYIK